MEYSGKEIRPNTAIKGESKNKPLIVVFAHKTTATKTAREKNEAPRGKRGTTPNRPLITTKGKKAETNKTTRKGNYHIIQRKKIRAKSLKRSM